MNDDDKKAAALAAIDEVRAGMLVGLGTGSTAAFAIRGLGERVAQGLHIRAVATSEASATLARSVGLDVLDFADIGTVDLTIDGADEIAPDCTAMKGAGGAMLREKVVATASRRMIAIADGTKRVAALGAAKLPVEVVPFARTAVTQRLRGTVDTATLRLRDRKPYLTDSGNIIIDCTGWRHRDPVTVAATLEAMAGVVGHGLFLTEVHAAYIATNGIVTRVERDQTRG